MKRKISRIEKAKSVRKHFIYDFLVDVIIECDCYNQHHHTQTFYLAYAQIYS